MANRKIRSMWFRIGIYQSYEVQINYDIALIEERRGLAEFGSWGRFGRRQEGLEKEASVAAAEKPWTCSMEKPLTMFLIGGCCRK